MRKRRYLWIILAVVAVALIVGGFFVWRRVRAGSGVEEERSAVVERRTTRVTVTASGRIEPDSQVNLSFDLPGRVKQVFVELGDQVQAGDPLAQLETENLERAVTQAELNLDQAQLSLEKMQEPADEVDIRQAENAVAQAADALEVAEINLSSVLSSTLLNETLEDARSDFENAENHLERRRNEYERGEIGYHLVDQALQDYEDEKLALARIEYQAELQLENARNEVARARRNYQEAVDNLERLREGADALDLETAQLEVERAQLALENARSDLEDATLTAPFDGTVSAVNIEAGETAPSTQPALSLVDTSHFRIEVSVDEIDVARLSEILPVEITVDALPEAFLTGSVERIGPAATVAQGAVSYPVIISIDATDAPLRAGMSATAVIMVEELEDQLMIPNWVIRVDETTGQPFVYRQTQDGLQRVNVELGIRYEGYSQVLGGLEEGDVVVLVQRENRFFGQD